MIRKAVLHILNEQPLVADLYRLPEAGDAGLVCTNLRLMNGTRPVFIDDIRSTFFFPYHQIRFVEIPRAALAAADAEGGAVTPAALDRREAAIDATKRDEVAAGPARIGGGRTQPRLAERVPSDEDAGAPPEPEDELELDEDFLRRIRDI